MSRYKSANPAWVPPTVRWITRDQVPPGIWHRNTHHRVPITPLYADYSLAAARSGPFEMLNPGFAAALGSACGVFSPPPSLPRPWTPREDNEWLVVDGYAYTEERPSQRASRPQVGTDVRPVVDRWEREVRPMIERRLEELRAMDLGALSDPALAEELRERAHFAAEVWGHYGCIAWSDFLTTRHPFKEFCESHLVLDESGWVQLLAGASSAAREPVEDMECLAREIAASPALSAALDSDDPWGNAPLVGLLEAYVDQHGHRTSGWEYVTPTLAEQPERVVALVREAVGRVRDGSAGAAHRTLERRLAFTAEQRARLESDALRQEFDSLLALVHRTYDGNERGVVLEHHAAGQLRRAIMEAGRRLAERGLLVERDRVFFLRRPELEDALDGQIPENLRERTDRRFAEYKRQWNETPPDVLGKPPATQDGATNGVVRGLGASPGVYEGRARVILTERDFERVQPGDVLVCPITSPPWTVLFGRIGALVTDVGSLLAHPAIAAREFGLPAVVGTRRATKTFTDGQTLRVDGTRGLVEAL